MSYRINTEEYYQRFIHLQEKLRKSEEERLKLEIRLNKMMLIIQTEEQRHYHNLSSQYKQFWEEDKKRQDRNNYILRILDRVENQSEALEEKARRLSTIRDQYYGIPRRHYDDNKPNYGNQQFYDNDSNHPSPERDTYSPRSAKEYNKNKNFNLQHQEKMEYLNKYLENIDLIQNNDKNSAMKSPRKFSSKSPTYNKTTNLKLDDLRPSTDLGYKVENFLTNRYSYQNFNDDDSATSTPSGSPRYNETPTIRNRSKSPKSTRNFEMDDLELGNKTNYHFADLDENTRLSRFPRRINRSNNKQTPKKVPSSDYKNSLKKLQKIQENSRKILSQHIPRTNYYRNESSNYPERPMLYQNDLTWNYPVASDFGLNMYDIYQPDKVIQKYLMEKYNTFLTDRYFSYPLNPFHSYHDRMIFDNFPNHPYRRHDYIRNLSNRYESTFTYPRTSRTYNETPLTSGSTLNKLDEHYSKPPKANQISGLDNSHRKYDELRKDEKAHGIHFNDSDQILEYDKNKPSREYDKKYELNKKVKEDQISADEVNCEYDFVEHERDRGLIKQDNDKDEDTGLSPLNIDENTNVSSNFSNNMDNCIESDNSLKDQDDFTNISMKNTQKALDMNLLNNPKNIAPDLNSVNESTIYEDIKDKVQQNTIPSVESIIPEEISYKSFSIEESVDKNKDCHLNGQNENDDVDIEKLKDPIIPVELTNKDIELVAGDKPINEDIPSEQDFEEKIDEINQDPTESIKTDCNESQLYDQNSQIEKLDEIQDSVQYYQTGQQIQYDENGKALDYNETGLSNEYHDNNQSIPYDQNTEQIQYDEHGQPIQYDENGQPIQYDGNGETIQYDQNGQQLQYDENGQPIHYSETEQSIQYDENGQSIQYDQDGHAVQYDENGQLLQYDANGQLLQYDENGMPIQYDQNGQQLQYDENGQQIHYDANGEPIQYEGSAGGYNEDSYFAKDEDPIANQEVNEIKTNGSSKANVFEMLDTDTESIKQDTKVSNDSDFELTT